MTDALLQHPLWPDAEPARNDIPVSAATSAAATRRNWIAVACASTPAGAAPRRARATCRCAMARWRRCSAYALATVWRTTRPRSPWGKNLFKVFSGSHKYLAGRGC